MMKMLVAIASKDGKFISQHFGHSPYFYIVEIDQESYEWTFKERRENVPPCHCGEHDHQAFAHSISLVADCQAIFAVKVGNYAKTVLQRQDIQVLEVTGFIDDILTGYIFYLKKQKEKKQKLDKTPKIEDHPCFNGEIHGKKGRLHLPVSPACNIQCRFCQRACNKQENRPGVAAGILPVEEAVSIVGKALELCPEITVVGVAGPGDSLASYHALAAFEKVHQAYPHLIKCLSTNGLALPGKADLLWDLGVRTVTVTVNAVEPEMVAKIVAHIVWEKKVFKGSEAGEILIHQQLEGIRQVSQKGIVVKVNTVLIPTINDQAIGEIARTVRQAGAAVHNIIPLIPQHEFRRLPPPTCEEIEAARRAGEVYLKQFRHCQHCRADACGIIGKEDLSYKLYGGRRMETFSHG